MSTKNITTESVSFVFLCGKKDRNGFFVTEEFFDFLERYFRAKEKGGTWADLYNELDAFGADFMSTFYDCEKYNGHSEDELKNGSKYDEDDPGGPGPYDHLEPWVFGDIEFPVIQCATETYDKYRHLFPIELERERILAEFMMPVGLYPRYRLPEIGEHLAEAGHRLTVRLFQWSAIMYDYTPKQRAVS